MKANKTVRVIATLLIATFGMLAFESDVSAEQHKQMVKGREVVVHTNPIPVILHRMVPPQHGRHVTQKEVANGKVPQLRANNSIRKRS